MMMIREKTMKNHRVHLNVSVVNVVSCTGLKLRHQQDTCCRPRLHADASLDVCVCTS